MLTRLIDSKLRNSTVVPVQARNTKINETEFHKSLKSRLKEYLEEECIGIKNYGLNHLIDPEKNMIISNTIYRGDEYLCKMLISIKFNSIHLLSLYQLVNMINLKLKNLDM